MCARAWCWSARPTPMRARPSARPTSRFRLQRRRTSVLLVEGDCAKPDLLHRLGIEEGPGLLDAIADEALDIEDCVIRTDIPQLSVLPAGARSHDDTELLASDRAGALLDALVADDLRRILVFDSRSEEHTTELQSLMRTSYAVFS